MSFLSEKRYKYSNFYNRNKAYHLGFGSFPTSAFLRFSSVDMYISTITYSDDGNKLKGQKRVWECLFSKDVLKIKDGSLENGTYKRLGYDE